MLEIESSYICPSCGEDIVVPVDPTQGNSQEYVEDCPVCCSPVLLRVSATSSEDWHIQANAE